MNEHGHQRLIGAGPRAGHGGRGRLHVLTYMPIRYMFDAAMHDLQLGDVNRFDYSSPFAEAGFAMEKNVVRAPLCRQRICCDRDKRERDFGR